MADVERPAGDPPEPPELPEQRSTANWNKNVVRITYGLAMGAVVVMTVAGIFSGGKTQAEAAEDKALAGGAAAATQQQAPSLEGVQQKVDTLKRQFHDLDAEIADRQATLKRLNADPARMTGADLRREMNPTDQQPPPTLDDLERRRQQMNGGGSSTPPRGVETRTEAIAGGEVPNISGKPAPWQQQATVNTTETGERAAETQRNDSSERPHVTTMARLDQPTTPNRREPLDFDPATTQTYFVPAGTIIKAVLKNRLEGEGTGAVLLMVTEDVRDTVTHRLYIPAGATVLGNSASVSNLGQRRLAVTFSRIIVRGNHTVYGIPLEDSLPGMNQAGAVGFDGKVNAHVMSVLGSAMAVGLIGGLAQIGNGYSGFGYSPGVEMRNGFTMGTGQAAMQILDRYLNRMPTITVPEGKRALIILIHDVPMPDNDEMEREAIG